MKAVGWILVAAAFFITAPVTALVVGAVQAKSSCETDLHREETDEPHHASIILDIKNQNVKTFYNVCVLDGTGANWGRYEFSLGNNDARTLTWSLPAEAFEYRVGFGGLSLGGAEHSITRIDLAQCPGYRHEAVWTTTSSPAGNKYTLTPVHCEPEDESGFDAIQDQAILAPLDGPWTSTGSAVAAIGILGAATLWAARRHLPWVPALFGFFTRLTQPNVLQQRVRSVIRELVAADPGIHLQAIADRLETARTVVTYHLGVLCRSNVLARVTLPGQNCYFVRGEFTPNRMLHIAVLRSRPLSRAFEVIKERSGLSLTELGLAMGVRPARASKIAKRLIEVGLVKKTVQNRRALFFATT